MLNNIREAQRKDEERNKAREEADRIRQEQQDLIEERKNIKMDEVTEANDDEFDKELKIRGDEQLQLHGGRVFSDPEFDLD